MLHASRHRKGMAMTLQSHGNTREEFTGVLCLFPRRKNRRERGHGRASTPPYRQCQRLLEEVMEQSNVNGTPALGQFLSNEPHEIMTRYQIQKMCNRLFLLDPVADGCVVARRLWSAFIFQRKLAVLPAKPDYYNRVVVLAIAIRSEITSRANFGLRHPVD